MLALEEFLFAHTAAQSAEDNAGLSARHQLASSAVMASMSATCNGALERFGAPPTGPGKGL